MISKLAKTIAHFFVKQNIAESKNEAIYAYGMELLLSDVLNGLLALIIALVSGTVFPTLLFFTVFMILRRFSGGYHANTHYGCILTMVVYSSVQYSDARKEYSALRDELAASDSEIVRLEGEKDARVDLEEVERIAVDELGMIQKDKAENVYVSVSANDNVVLEKIEDQGEAETSLLSAFAERLKALWEYFN